MFTLPSVFPCPSCGSSHGCGCHPTNLTPLPEPPPCPVCPGGGTDGGAGGSETPVDTAACAGNFKWCVDSPFNWPAVDGGALVTLQGPCANKLFPGAVLYNKLLGVLHVVLVVDDTHVQAQNLGEAGQTLIPGEQVIAGTCFGVGVPLDGSIVGNRVGPYLASDFVVPAACSPGDTQTELGAPCCVAIKLTTVDGLSTGDRISIKGYQYRLAIITDAETVTICNEGSGGPQGTLIKADEDTDGLPDYPVVKIDGNSPCTAVQVVEGKLMVCGAGGVQTTLQGQFSGQIPQWDHSRQLWVLVAAGVLPKCVALTSDFTTDPNNTTGYVIVISSSAEFTANSPANIGTALFNVTAIIDATHVRVKPVAVQTAPVTYTAGTRMCVSTCCSGCYGPDGDKATTTFDTLQVCNNGVDMRASYGNLDLAEDGTAAAYKAAGLWLRGQDGKFSFVPVPRGGDGKPAVGFALITRVIDDNGTVGFGWANNGSLDLTFEMGPSTQFFVVPPGVTSMTVKAWGAGGGSNGAGTAIGGYGGYTTATIEVEGGDKFAVVVGGVSGFTAKPGFGGIGGNVPNQYTHAGGGGLSGVFTGDTAVVATDMSRAVAVAGGGGGYWGTLSSHGNGGNGNYSSAAEASMQGQNHSGGISLGAGGGGYAGGPRGNGGKGFTVGGATGVQVLTGAQPGWTDPDYLDSHGGPNKPGLVIIKFT